jgi:hypothetical protein
VYNILNQRIQHLPLDYSKETARAIISKLSEIQTEDKIGFKYKVGLWMGMFFDGMAWNPPSSKDFILSLRLNDRLQYTWYSDAHSECFVYVGGFIDAALKEIANKTSNEFVFAGFGYSYKSISVTISGFVPLDVQGTRSGVAVTMMYDLPLEKIITVFN